MITFLNFEDHIIPTTLRFNLFESYKMKTDEFSVQDCSFLLKGEGVEISRMEKFIRCFGLEEAGVKGGRERSSETENFRRIVLNCLS